jgi:peptide/nickel transport system ATP-binding protein
VGEDERGTLRFAGVSVRFGSRRHGHLAVDDVDLVVPAGAVVGLVGESGSGKSTLARAAVGLAPLTAGRVLVGGKPVPRRGRRPVQMVFQDPLASLDPRMTAGESIAEAIPHGTAAVPGTAGTPGAAAGRGARRAQASRLARALAGQPEVIIADEITSALDVSTQGAVLNVVRDLQRELRLSMLFISHNLAVVRYVCDTVAVMQAGRIVECGPAGQVLADPAHDYTRELLAALPPALQPLRAALPAPRPLRADG